MKKFTKTLVASTVMALSVTGVAEAKIADGNLNTVFPDGSRNVDGGGEFVFNLVNYKSETATKPKNAFTVDLGVTVGQFLKNPNVAIGFNGLSDTNLQAFLAAREPGDVIKWGVAGSFNALAVESDAPLFGFYTTAVGGVPSVYDENASQVDNTIAKHNTMIGDINSRADVGIPYSENLTSFANEGSFGYTGNMSDDFQGALPFIAQGDLGATLSFVREHVGADFDSGAITDLGKAIMFDIQGNSASLTVSPVSNVPLPAAVWMFGAGLLGMLRINRRKTGMV